jgi:hypothetical protein
MKINEYFQFQEIDTPYGLEQVYCMGKLNNLCYSIWIMHKDFTQLSHIWEVICSIISTFLSVLAVRQLYEFPCAVS